MNSNLDAVYERLERSGGRTDHPVVVGQMGQSLDGFIATSTGASHYVTGEASLVHLHRLRSWADVVVIGWRTAVSDDPRLTVRLVPGQDPVRAVIDPNHRVPEAARLFAGPAGASMRVGPTGDLVVPVRGGRVAPPNVIAALAKRGFRRVLIEGGGQLVSSFLQAQCLDRIHVVVAPMLIGDGVPGLRPRAVTELDQALRPATETYALGTDVLFDMDLAEPKSPSTSV